MRRAFAMSAAVLSLSACASRHDEQAASPPSLVRSAVAPVAAPKLDNYGRLLLPEGSTVLVQGDQTAYAPAPPGAAKTAAPINGVEDRRLPDAWPIAFARRLEHRVQVTEAVYPGDYASDGLSRWSTTPPADVNIVAYGLNEATREEYPAPTSDFRKALQALVARGLGGGGWVVLVVPPPYPDRGVDGALAPYRDVVRSFAGGPRTLLFDPARVLRATPGAWSGKRRLSDAGQRALGDAISGLFRLTPRAPSAATATGVRHG